MEKVTVVITVKNDEEGVRVLLAYIEKQTLKADEVIIIDAGDYRDCSRGEGRNIGIEKARNNIIAVTDVGCRPHENWLEILATPLLEKKADVAAGFFRTTAKTSLQKAITPFLSKKWSENYLPASRSIAFTREVWKKVGGYPKEAIYGGEDLEFARRLRNEWGIKIEQVPRALVDWEVPDNLGDFMKDIQKHTMGNFEVKYWPHIWRNLSVILRWIMFILYPWLLAFYLIWILGKIRFLTSQIATSQTPRNDGEEQIATTPRRRFVMTVKTTLWLAIVQMASDITIIATLLRLLLRSGKATPKACAFRRAGKYN